VKTLIAVSAAALSSDFARANRPDPLPVFQVLVLAAIIVPAELIFSRYNRPLAMDMARALHNHFEGGVCHCASA
jgi:hypothetical protein